MENVLLWTDNGKYVDMNRQWKIYYYDQTIEMYYYEQTMENVLLWLDNVKYVDRNRQWKREG